MQTVSSLQTPKMSEVPPELQDLYNNLYVKIATMVSGGPVFDIRSDPTVLRVILQSAMVTVESFKNADGTGWNGQEKKSIALVLIKFVINDLVVKGKVDPAVAREVVLNIDFWGGLAMDLAVDAANLVIDLGQKAVANVKAIGCKKACAEGCCMF